MRHIFRALTMVFMVFCHGVALSFSASSEHGNLAEQFAAPPQEAKPWIMWYWIRGNVTREGIDADLESMARVGIGGVYIMNIGATFTAPGPVVYMSDEYRALMQHAMERCAELGMTAVVYNCDGFSSSGGPWMNPEESMQRLCWTEARVSADASGPIVLKKPHSRLDYYRDEAVVAFPTPSDEAVSMREAGARVSSPGTGDVSSVVDGDWDTGVEVVRAEGDKAAVLDFHFDQPFTVRSLFLLSSKGAYPHHMELLVSDDGKSYRKAGEGRTAHSPGYTYTFCELTIPQTTARHFRLVMGGAKIAVAECELSGGERIPNWTQKAGYILGYVESGRWTEAADAAGCIPIESVIDLTGTMRPDGTLDWQPPAGDWSVLRFGMTTTAMECRPAGPGGVGLETDKFSKAATRKHFDHMLGVLAEQLGDLTGTTYIGSHVDSWEVGAQNWNPGFSEEFESRRGYSIRKFLPAMTGRVLNDARFTERFLWDFRKTVADLIAENYYLELRKQCNAHGMKLSVQALRPLIDEIQCAGYSDIPFANVQIGRQFDPSSFRWGKAHSSAGHLYGREMISSESLTARPEDEKWEMPPWKYKPYNDLDFTAGVNHQTLHVFAHQPWTGDVVPGMTLNRWGLHLERSNTWWEQSKPWMEYLQRTQFLLQKGVFAADVLLFMGDDGPTKAMDASFLKKRGFDYDLSNAEALLKRVRVDEDGRIVAPNGTRYRVLSLNAREWMRPELLRRIRELIEAGAVVHGEPPVFSPSLRGYPGSDNEMRALVEAMWTPGETVRTIGKGRLYSGCPLEAVLSREGIQSDFRWTHQDGADHLGWIHYRFDGAEAYFVANFAYEPSTGTAAFRVAGRTPEFWNPETGARKLVSQFEQKNGVTEIPLDLEPAESVIIVFPEQPTTSGEVISNLKSQISNPLSGPWTVEFQPGRGAPQSITLPKLIDLSTHSEEGVKYFSGTATYSTEFNLQSEIINRQLAMFLDLGRVEVLAEVVLNGENLGILWRPPFRVDVSDAVVEGMNRLELRVTNTWPNRLIGDERMYPEDLEFEGREPSGPALQTWPDWLDNPSKKRPTGRVTLTTWKHWFADDELLPSGLIGPVSIIQMEGK